MLRRITAWWHQTPAGLRARGFPIGTNIDRTVEQLESLQKRSWPWVIAGFVGILLLGLLPNLGMAVLTVWLVLSLPWFARAVRIRWLRAQLLDVVLLGVAFLALLVATMTAIYSTIRLWL